MAHPTTPGNDTYSIFIGIAALAGYVQLEDLLRKWNAEVSNEIVADAARFGVQRATNTMFPREPRLPFDIDPTADVVAALRLHYGMSHDSDRFAAQSSSRRVARPEPSSSRSYDEPTARDAGSSTKRTTISSDRLPRIRDTSDAAASHRMTNGGRVGGVRQRAMDSMEAKLRSGRPGEPSSVTPSRPAAENPSPVKPSPKLQKVTKSALFPWEKRRQDSTEIAKDLGTEFDGSD